MPGYLNAHYDVANPSGNRDVGGKLNSFLESNNLVQLIAEPARATFNSSTLVEVTLELFDSKRKFTMVNEFFNVTSISHFTMVNASLVCCVSNGTRMKAKFTIVKPSQKAWFITRLSELCLFR